MQDTIQINLPVKDTISEIQQVDSINPLHDTLIPVKIVPLKEKTIAPEKLFQNPLQNSSTSSDSVEVISRTDSIELSPFILE